jgi:hypothetical protein
MPCWLLLHAALSSSSSSSSPASSSQVRSYSAALGASAATAALSSTQVLATASISAAVGSVIAQASQVKLACSFLFALVRAYHYFNVSGYAVPFRNLFRVSPHHTAYVSQSNAMSVEGSSRAAVSSSVFSVQSQLSAQIIQVLCVSACFLT